MKLNDVATQFATETRDHVLTILLDEGLHRHLRIARPGTVVWSYEIVTWPGYLAIVGDLGESYTFRRLDDMLQFFRNSMINPYYWAEKLVTGNTVTAYDEDLLGQLAKEYAASAIRYGSAPAGIGLALREQLLEELCGDEGTDRALLDEPIYTYRAVCSCGARRRVGSLSSGWAWGELHKQGAATDGVLHMTQVETTGSYQFRDTWEWNPVDYTWSFLRACHAIRRAVEMYDAARVPATAGGAS